MMTKSKSKAKREIMWLFLNPVNPQFVMQETTPSADSWANMSGATFIKEVLAPEIRELYFDPLIGSLNLWIVSHPTPLFVLRSKLQL